MLKKLASLLLSLLLCLSLLPGQTGDAHAPEDGLPVQIEASETGRPDDPDELVILTAEEFPGEIGTDHSEE